MLGDQASFCQVRRRSAVGLERSDYGTVGAPASFVVGASRNFWLRATRPIVPLVHVCAAL
jgi:hypothetical protein